MKALTCILQFVFLEVSLTEKLHTTSELALIPKQVFSNTSGNWSFHLKAADALLPSLVETRIEHLHQDAPDFTEHESQEKCFLSQDNYLAIEFLLGAFT